MMTKHNTKPPTATDDNPLHRNTINKYSLLCACNPLTTAPKGPIAMNLTSLLSSPLLPSIFSHFSYVLAVPALITLTINIIKTA